MPEKHDAGPSRSDTAIPVDGAAVLQAETAYLDGERAEVVEQGSFPSGKGVSLRGGLPSRAEETGAGPDMVFRLRASRPGRYVVRTHAATDAAGTEAMRRARSKHDSMFMKIAVGDGRPTRRVVFVPWSAPESCRQTAGKFDLVPGEQEIRIWLPEGMRLDRLELEPYVPPKVPEAAADYRPGVVPPPSRPRIWVSRESLPGVRANLDVGENAPLWRQVRETAARPFEFRSEPGTEVAHDAELEKAAVAKAFVCLMSGDRELGRQAVVLIRDYLAAVEFGNLLDITREIGRAIYSAALVYDWCYDLMSPEDREGIRKNLMRLADDMEIGWPPFKQMIVNGHGNEAQVNRDLLCMAIALYDEDPVPYRYCSYRILEELVPMRRFEYQSPRHNQGVSYGPYRFCWDLHAAWLFYRMSGRRVFDENIAEVYQYWLYMRLPNGEMLRDGDGFSDGRPAHLGATPLLSYAYSRDPVAKRDFLRQGGLPHEPILALMLNDPNLEAAKDFSSLPLTLDFGPILGSMVARTGWDMGRGESDVVVEMKGGGYHFGNHQHPDAGAFQIYWRGLQAADLGQYHFYGTPYDMNFCKRSVSHSVVLAVDLEERFPSLPTNDGGARNVRSCPLTPEQARTDPTFANGTVLSADFGPHPVRPFYSFFSVDLTSAYGPKIGGYVRSFCFLNLDDGGTPAALIVLDRMSTARPEVVPHWQVNTLRPPEGTTDGVVLRNTDLGMTGRVDVRMLRPRPEEREMRILGGREAYTVSGQHFDPPFPDRPEANGHRVVFTPRKAGTDGVFLTVLSMRDDGARALPVDLAELPEAYVLALADRVVVMGRNPGFLSRAFQVEVKGEGMRQLLLTPLAPGAWSLRSEDGDVSFNTRVAARRNTAFFVVPGGRYTVRPEAIPGAADYAAPPDLAPDPR